jgi:ribonuclease D
MYKDIWSIIKDALQDESPISTYILLAHTAYGHSARQLSRSIKEPFEEVEARLESLKLKLNTRIITEGLNPKNISNLFAINDVIEVNEQIDDSFD